jgi:hypothetical protein
VDVVNDGHQRGSLAVLVDLGDEAPEKLIERSLQHRLVGGLSCADEKVGRGAEPPAALLAADSALDLQRRRVVARRELEVVVAERDGLLEDLGKGLAASGLKSLANSVSEKCSTVPSMELTRTHGSTFFQDTRTLYRAVTFHFICPRTG